MFCFEVIQKNVQVTINTFGRKIKSMSNVNENKRQMLENVTKLSYD